MKSLRFLYCRRPDPLSGAYASAWPGMLRLPFIILLLAWSLCVSSLQAQTPDQAAIPDTLIPETPIPEYPTLLADDYPVPTDMSAVHFYLITVDVGNNVYDNFGHTALRVIDQNSNTDLVFNWGVFDVSGGAVSFSYNFFKGIMRYRLATSTPANEFAIYRDQQRSVWQDKVNLTNPEKEILYRRLLWNLEEENRQYDYHYFFDNCTTRVRDYLDEATGGRIAQHFDGETTDTFRDQVKAHYSSLSLISLSLDVLMNSNIDRRVTQWEAMYLPLELRRSLAEVSSDVAVNGVRQPLLSDYQVIMDFPPPMQQTDGYQVASVVLLGPALLLLILLKRIPQSYFATHSRVGLKMAPLSFRLLGLMGLLTALFSGIYGILMLGSWFVSDHLDLHHNMNLLLFWPTDILGVLVALRWLLFCRPWPLTHNTGPFINYYILAHVVAMLVYAVVAFADMSAQSIADIALYVLPGFFLFTVLMWIVGFEPAKPKNMFF